MTEERIEKLTNYLREDQEKELVLLQMQPEEACIKIQADGYDYTVDEIIEYGNLVRTVAAQMDDEISEADLEMVAGAPMGRRFRAGGFPPGRSGGQGRPGRQKKQKTFLA